ncbi:extracellular solute-binding protein [Catenulispora subtropica]|uniref:Extracellular solute-binding protein n=1 Tax=Catenulispora subtropica TaxID=450798 RepID=A0ABP5DQ34_9ACTN
MARMRTFTAAVAALACTALITAGCSSGGGKGGQAKTGPIKIWYSNNAQEVTWGKATVAAWNKDHPDQQVSGEEIPAGSSSEEVIGAAIAAGNAPCLVFNGSPSAISGWVKQGGLVPLNDFADGASYVEQRSGAAVAAQYKSSDGKYYQLPWKSNPVMIFYNKDMFKAAGLDADHPALSTYSDFLAAAQKVTAAGGAQYAIAPAPTNEFFQNWFDFYPLYIAQSGGKALVDNGKATFDDPDGQAVADFWSQIYAKGLAPKEKYNGDAFADKKAAMAIVGPWAIAVYGTKVNWGAVPVPTATGMPADQIHTFADSKTVSVFSACKNRQTAWDFLKFATNQDNDGALLNTTGQMPLRADLSTVYASYFTAHPAYTQFAQQAARTVDVPNVANGVAMWQDFRNGYLKSVVFGQQPTGQWLKDAAGTVASDIAK